MNQLLRQFKEAQQLMRSPGMLGGMLGGGAKGKLAQALAERMGDGGDPGYRDSIPFGPVPSETAGWTPGPWAAVAWAAARWRASALPGAAPRGVRDRRRRRAAG